MQVFNGFKVTLLLLVTLNICVNCIAFDSQAEEIEELSNIVLLGDGDILVGPNLTLNSFKGVEKINYKVTPQGDLYLHVFKSKLVDQDTRPPALIFFHGGGFKNAIPGQFYPYAKHLTNYGITVICAEYRVKNKHGTERIHSILDGKSAVSWVTENAEKLGINRNSISVGGGSAGGYMAAVTAIPTDIIINSNLKKPNIGTTELIPKLIFPQASILLNPGLSLELNTQKYFPKKGRNATFSEIGENYPPTLILLGTEDFWTSQSEAEEFCALLKKQRVPCDIVMYEDQEHSFFNRDRYLYDTAVRVEVFLRKLGIIDTI